MRSIRPNDADLTAQARIRDVAIELIGRQGFEQVTVREIAVAAAVSPGLVIHHFGSKAGLRAACDDRVRQVLTEALADLEQHGPAGAMAQLARTEEYLPIVDYAYRTLRDGGPMAQALFDSLVDATESWVRLSVADGLVRPAGDEAARAKLLVAFSLGVHFVESYLLPDVASADHRAAVADSFTDSALEIYTHGLFTGPEYVDAFRSHRAAASATEEH